MNYDEDPTRHRPVYKSKAEIQIARLLDREGITFQYEHPLAVVDRGQTKIWYPDFSLCDYGMIMEYFGMNGDGAYRKRAEHKLQVYRENRIEGVFLTEESFRGDGPTRVLGQIEAILQGRLDRFYGCRRRTIESRPSACERVPYRRP
jgi:hypothetical protein